MMPRDKREREREGRVRVRERDKRHTLFTTVHFLRPKLSFEFFSIGCQELS